MSNMQQRRPHSNASAVNGGSDSSRDQRRIERRLAKERRAGGGAGKKLKRVKRSNAKYRKSPCAKIDPHLQIALLTFGLFSLSGMTIFRMFHHDGGGSAAPGHGNHAANDGEYNSDTVARPLNSDGGGLLSKLRGHKYRIPDSMEFIGNKDRWYASLREEYDTKILPKDDERSVKFVEGERKRQGVYTQSPDAQTPYDIHDCPDHPPEGYPMQWPVLDVTANWPTDDPEVPDHGEIYQGICVFDYATEMDKMKRYRHREVPFIVRNDPAVARTAERWNFPGYMDRLLDGKEDTQRRTEYSPNNHFMYWVDKRTREEKRKAAKELKQHHKNGDNVFGGFGRGDQDTMAHAMHELEEFNELKAKLADAKEYLENHDDDEAEEEVNRLKHLVNNAKRSQKDAALESWQPPTENLRMTYAEWLEHANVTDDKLGPDNPHWYFRLIGCGSMGEGTENGSCDKGSSEWLFDELTFFQPWEGEKHNFYLVEPKKQKGIHCRFGMKGVIAENHFDLSRNAITLLGGQRRYILGDPSQCMNMNLLPRGHPSSRHSAVDWSNPDLRNFPTFAEAHVNEIVMQPGDVLYLPTNWFHYIISLELNMQCNTRSGGEKINRNYITECGF